MSGHFRVSSFALLLLCAMSAGALAQDLVIRGRVVDSTGHGLEAASVSLEGMQLATHSALDGSYTLVVPDSIVRGQMSLLIAQVPGFQYAYLPVSIGGSILTHDFVLRSAETRRGVKTSQPEEDKISIWGRVADSTGAGLPSVAVVLEGLAAGGETDLNGYYHFTVPALRVRDQRIVIVVRRDGASSAK